MHQVSPDLPVIRGWRTRPPLDRLTVVGDHLGHELAPAVRTAGSLSVLRLPGAGLPTIKGSIATFFSRDKNFARRVWEGEGALGPALVHSGYEAVIAPAYSTYWRSSPFVIQSAIARSASLAMALARHLPTIPTFVWSCDDDLLLQVRWAAASGCRSIALDLGPLWSSQAWPWAVRAIEVTAASFTRLGVRVQLVTNGVTSRAHIAEVCRTWPWEVSFLTRGVWVQSRKHRVLMPDLSPIDDETDRTADQLLLHNMQQIRHVIDEAARRRELSRTSDRRPITGVAGTG